jgi:hypothetical protein
MIVLYPIVLFAAFAVLLRSQREDVHEGPMWFASWVFGGALFTFSFLTGFIGLGLVLLPLAGVMLFWVASRAPGREAIGFLAGVGLVWMIASPFAGLLVCALAMGAYALPLRRA